MDAVLEAQCLALGAMQRACALRPRLHEHQLFAIERERALCAAAIDLCGYQRSGGGGLEPVRAAWLDRVVARFRLAQALGDVFGAHAALAEYRIGLDTQRIDEWPVVMATAAQAAAPWRARAAAAASAFTRCLHNLLLHRMRALDTNEHRCAARVAWNDLCVADPELAQALRGQGGLPARAALRLPWIGPESRALRSGMRSLIDAPGADGLHGEASRHGAGAQDLGATDEGLAALHKCWRVRVESAGVTGGVEWGTEALSAEIALAPWRVLAGLQGAVSPCVRATALAAVRLLEAGRGAANAPEVQRRGVESGLLVALAAAPLHAQLDELAARQQVWPQPLLAAHVRCLRDGLAAANTDIEVELLAAHADACLGIEADWQTLLFSVALGPLHAALAGALGGHDCARAEAGVLAHELLGCAPRRLLKLPLCRNAAAEQWAGALACVDGHQDALHAEAGYELLPPLRAWLAVTAAQGRRLPASTNGLLRALRVLVGASFAGAQPTRKVRLQLWERRESASAWARLLAEPCRPPVPGWALGVAAGTAL